MSVRISRLAMLLPYAAVAVGLLWLESAWLSILLYHAGMVLFMLFVRSRRPERLLRMRVPTWLILSSVIIFAAAGPLFYILRDVVGASTWGRVLADVGLSGPRWPLFVAYFALIHPAIEEIFWRGSMSPSTRLIAFEDFAFAGYHAMVLHLFLPVSLVVLAVLVMAVVAAVWRKMREASGGLLWPMLTHTIADASIVVAAYVIVGPV